MYSSVVHECFCHSRTLGGQKLRQRRRCYRIRIAPRVRYAVASRKYWFPCQGNDIVWSRGGGRGGGKRSWSKVLPPSVCGPLVFCCCLRKGFFLIFLQAHKYWRETHLLDPLHLGWLLLHPTFLWKDKGEGRWSASVNACHRFSRRWSIRCTTPPTLCMIVVKQFIRALHDVYALTFGFGLIVAPTLSSTKWGGREMICFGQRTPSLLTTMVDAMYRSPYTVYDGKSNMDYRWSYGNQYYRIIILKNALNKLMPTAAPC